MKAIKQKKYSELTVEEDENLNALLIYGRNVRSNLNQLVVWYNKKDGLEAFYYLKSVLTSQQIEKVKTAIMQFDPKAEVKL